MDQDEDATARRAMDAAALFGARIKTRRKDLKIRQDQLALVAGVGRRFLIELESGKPSCQLGRSLLVAEALGFTPTTILGVDAPSQCASYPELPEMIDEMEPVDG
jgi:transcriptional regulator with XRE-family HTH domain